MRTVRQITLAGDLDYHYADEHLARVIEFMSGERSDCYVVDLRDVTFIDSIGLSTLLTIRNRATALKADVELMHAPRQVRQVLEMSGLLGLFSFVEV